MSSTLKFHYLPVFLCFALLIACNPDRERQHEDTSPQVKTGTLHVNLATFPHAFLQAKVTIHKLVLHTENREPVEVFKGSYSLDIAQLSAIPNGIMAIDVPVGTYHAMEIELGLEGNAFSLWLNGQAEDLTLRDAFDQEIPLDTDNATILTAFKETEGLKIRDNKQNQIILLFDPMRSAQPVFTEDNEIHARFTPFIHAITTHRPTGFQVDFIDIKQHQLIARPIYADKTVSFQLEQPPSILIEGQQATTEALYAAQQGSHFMLDIIPSSDKALTIRLETPSEGRRLIRARITANPDGSLQYRGVQVLPMYFSMPVSGELSARAIASATLLDDQGSARLSNPDEWIEGQLLTLRFQGESLLSITVHETDLIGEIVETDPLTLNGLTLADFPYSGPPVKLKEKTVQQPFIGQLVSAKGLPAASAFQETFLKTPDPAEITLSIILPPTRTEPLLRINGTSQSILLEKKLANLGQIRSKLQGTQVTSGWIPESLQLKNSRCSLMTARVWPISYRPFKSANHCLNETLKELESTNGHLQELHVKGRLTENAIMQVTDIDIVIYPETPFDEILTAELPVSDQPPSKIIHPLPHYQRPLAKEMINAGIPLDEDYRVYTRPAINNLFRQASLALLEEPLIIEFVFADDASPNAPLQGPDEVQLIFDPDSSSPGRLSREAFEKRMANVGQKVADILRTDLDPALFSSQEKLMAHIESRLRANNTLPKGQSLFDYLIRPNTNIDEVWRQQSRSQLARDFQPGNTKKAARRNHMTAITALHWHMETLKEQKTQNQPGAATVEDFENLNKFYLKYIEAANEKHGFHKKLDYSDLSINLYKELTVRKGIQGGSSIAYSRQGMSSHLKQKDLINPIQFGIDLRISSDTNALPLLPTERSHILVGLFQAPEYKGTHKMTLFYKMEPHGVSKLADFLAHGKDFVQHQSSGGARRGSRETNLDKAAVERLFKLANQHLASKGMKVDDGFKEQFLKDGAVKVTTGTFVRNLIRDMNRFLGERPGFVKEALGEDAYTRIGSEQRIAKNRMGTPAFTRNQTPVLTQPIDNTYTGDARQPVRFNNRKPVEPAVPDTSENRKPRRVPGR